jgi:hypothetical protein
MRRWLRILCSGLISLLVFAATFPNVFLPSGGIWVSASIYILVMAFGPFVLICIFCGRNQIFEGIGWAGHFLTLAAVLFR